MSANEKPAAMTGQWMRVGRIVAFDEATREATLYTYSRISYPIDVPEDVTLCLGWIYMISGPGPTAPDRGPARIRADQSYKIPKSFMEESQWFAPTPI